MSLPLRKARPPASAAAAAAAGGGDSGDQQSDAAGWLHVELLWNPLCTSGAAGSGSEADTDAHLATPGDTKYAGVDEATLRVERPLSRPGSTIADTRRCIIVVNLAWNLVAQSWSSRFKGSAPLASGSSTSWAPAIRATLGASGTTPAAKGQQQQQQGEENDLVPVFETVTDVENGPVHITHYLLNVDPAAELRVRVQLIGHL